MAFGFGANNNNSNNANGGFGGFGSSNTGGGFGTNNNTSTGSSLFGGNNSTSGGFGGFGASNSNTTSTFGAPAKPAFGAPATGATNLFGGNNSASTGGFGASSGGFGNTANSGGGFGSSTSGGLFGSKPASGGFGSNTNTGPSLFGAGATASGGFGSSNNTGNTFGANNNASTSFGASTNTGGFAFGGGATNNASLQNNNGTAGTPFSPIKEQESNQTSMYQSITCQPAYVNKSFEELRTEDYAQGRMHGNSNGQAGSFGNATGFGNFGSANSNTNTGGGLFGNNNNNNSTSGGFGASTGGFGANNSSGFGTTNNATSGGSIFGSKPTSGGLFGAQPSNTTTAGFGATSTNSGGLFGGGGGFGGNNNASSTGTGLFSNNQDQQNKPAFGGFGANSTANNNTSGGFGSNTNTGGSLFGNSGTANTGGGLFGQNNQQQQQNNPFGAASSNTTGGLFGNQQNKSATSGLFGSTANSNTNAGGGLFGSQSNQQPQQQNNMFGQSSNSGGGLFGSQAQNKPAGGSLFGNNNNAGGSLFGGQSNQQGGSSLFGNNNTNTGGSSLFGSQQNKPAGSGLFGANNNSSTQGGLFGGQHNQQGGSSLFGSNNNANTGTTSLFGNQNNQNQQASNTTSLFGSMNQSQQPQQNQLHASLTGAPYGNEQLFSSLGAASPPVGPLATPLSGARPVPRKAPSLLASTRVNTPVYSPRGGPMGRGGYGFSYSTYGTPTSAYTPGSLTPGASSLLRPTGSLGSALTRRLNKSLSATNLRADGASGEPPSLLRPNILSQDGTPGRYGNNSVRKLHIDRSLRTDLFGPQPKAIENTKEQDGPVLKKRVSFENSAEKERLSSDVNTSNALVRTEEQENDDSPGPMRAGPRKSQLAEKAPEMEQMNGTLTTVLEDGEGTGASSTASSKTTSDPDKRNEVGHYWTKPALKDLRNMSRQQLKNVGSFTVGRDGVGRIEFGSVDLTDTPLEDVCGNIVQLNPRSATVYQDDRDKPSMGKALNVPSTIYLENSWPRSQAGRKPANAKSGKDYDKHVARLKRVNGTHFQNYDPGTGIWSFKVDHFTTYGLDDDDDDDDESTMANGTEGQDESSALGEAPETPVDQQDATMQSVDTERDSMDDTFEFKLHQRTQLDIPGGFEAEAKMYDYEEPAEDDFAQQAEHDMSEELHYHDDSVMSGGPVQAPSPGAIDRYRSSMTTDDAKREDSDAEPDLPGSFLEELVMPRSILKPSAFISPEKLARETWEKQLQRTMSPRKQDRQALKDLQPSFLRARQDNAMPESPFKQSILGRSAFGDSYLAQKSGIKTKPSESMSRPAKNAPGETQAFRTALDLMHSIFPHDKPAAKSVAGAKTQLPNPKKQRLSESEHTRPRDMEWHENLKPSFTAQGLLVHSVPGSWPQVSGNLPSPLTPLVDRHQHVRFTRIVPADDTNSGALSAQAKGTIIKTSSGFPAAQAPEDIDFASLAQNLGSGDAASAKEGSIWKLCSVLFDSRDAACASYMRGVAQSQIDQYGERMRMDALGAFWTQLVASSVQDKLKHARSPEEIALLYLTKNDIVSACDSLVAAKDFKLAMLISQLPGTAVSRKIIQGQIETWRTRSDWSEMSDAVRVLYTILSGELSYVQGKQGAAGDRVASFDIVERFGLSWQQSFGLWLFFGGSQSMHDSITSYNSYVTREGEQDGTKADTLMQLLRLYIAPQALTTLLDPCAISGSTLHTRLTWQIASLFRARGIGDLAAEDFDRNTYDYGTELENAGDLVKACWVLLHLCDEHARRKAVVGLLERQADKIPTPAIDGGMNTFDILTNTHLIPAKLIWAAKATYAKGALQDPGLQAEWLLRAGDGDAAHEVLCSTVGPRAVIEHDYNQLEKLLPYFNGCPVAEWESGGQLYAAYLRIVQDQHGKTQSAVLEQLRRGLAESDRNHSARRSLEEKVALIEMRRVLDEAMASCGDGRRNEETTDTGRGSSAGGQERDTLCRYQQAMGLII